MTITDVSEATGEVGETTITFTISSSSTAPPGGVSDTLVIGVSVAAALVLLLIIISVAAALWRRRSGKRPRSVDQPGLSTQLQPPNHRCKVRGRGVGLWDV